MATRNIVNPRVAEINAELEAIETDCKRLTTLYNQQIAEHQQRSQDLVLLRKNTFLEEAGLYIGAVLFLKQQAKAVIVYDIILNTQQTAIHQIELKPFGTNGKFSSPKLTMTPDSLQGANVLESFVIQYKNSYPSSWKARE